MVLSPHFTSLVGKDRTPITIHADVVKDISAPLHAMINNGVMTESTTRVAVLEDVEVEVFQKFCQFAYTGNYTVDETEPKYEDETKNSANTTAEDKPSAKNPSASVDESQEKKSNFSFTTTPPPSKTTIARNANTSHEFQRLRTRLRGQFQKCRQSYSPGHQLNYIARIHVDIYMFANKYLIKSLQSKCLDYLHYEIENIKPCPTPRKIVTMLTYIHNCTTPYDPVGMSELRGLIYQYACCHIRDLANEPTFKALFRSGHIL